MALGPQSTTTFTVDAPEGGSAPDLWSSGWSDEAVLVVEAAAAAFTARAGDRRPHVGLRLRTLDGRWSEVGRDLARGVMAEGLQLSADPGGPTSGGFRLRRTADRQWPDLRPFTAMEADVGGVPVWGGRVQAAPGQDASAIDVQAKGWQYDLDLDLFSDTFVHQRVSDWSDASGFLGAPLGNFRAGGLVAGENGAVVIGFPNGYTYAAGHAVGVILDQDQIGGRAKRLVVECEAVNPNAFCDVYLRSSDTDDVIGGTVTDFTSVSFNSIGTGSTHVAGTIGGGSRRYLSVFLYVPSGSGTTGLDHLLRIRRILIAGETAYESGNQSVLRASDVVKAARDAAAPALSTSNERIETSTFDIPHLTTDGYATPRAVMTAANAYHGWHLGVDHLRRVVFEARSIAPVAECGDWPGSDLSGLSSGSADDVYNRVIVEARDAANQTLTVIRTATSPLLDRNGLTRTAKLSVSAVATTAVLETIGDIWLSERARTPFRGTLTVTGIGGVRRIPGGASMHPAELLLHAGRRIRLGNLIDPDTGGIGRTGTMASVAYDDTQTQAVVQLDNDHERFEQLMARLGVLQEQMVR